MVLRRSRVTRYHHRRVKASRYHRRGSGSAVAHKCDKSYRYTLSYIELTNALTKEYSKQAAFRAWDRMISILPFGHGGLIYDLGCGTGDVGRALLNAGYATAITGVDLNPSMIAYAALTTVNESSRYICADLKNFRDTSSGAAGSGIWASFIMAYFEDPKEVLAGWCNSLLAPGGWVSLLEIDGLFSNHLPLHGQFSEGFKKVDEKLKVRLNYDPWTGSQLEEICVSSGLKVVRVERWQDAEIACDGPVGSEILEAWRARMERPGIGRILEEVFEERVLEAKEAFIECISSKEHYCLNKIVQVVAIKSK